MPIFTNSSGLSALFIHVPKTGGTYVEDLFRKNEYRRCFWEGQPKKLGLVCSPQHYHHAIYSQLFDLDALALQFMTVRHPVDRLLSEYRHQNPDWSTPLEAWLNQVEVAVGNNPMAFDNHLRPQNEFHDPHLEVFRQEDGFDKFWADRLNRRFDLGFATLEVPRRRKTSEGQTLLTESEYDAVLDFCERHYGRDYETFGYTPAASAAALLVR